MKRYRVLIACEFSGTVRDAFRARGIEALSCDLLPTESPGPHIQGDVREVLDRGWDLMIAHPPCTYLTNSGSPFLKPGGVVDRKRWRLMREGALFFKQLLEADIPMIAVENPIMHRYGWEIIGRRYDCKVQPWQHGHGEQKATCFWLKNLPPLRPTRVVEGREQKNRWIPPSPDRWKLRSLTYRGIAKAIAKQWGDVLMNNTKRRR